jgi:hypothetical protein
VPKPVAKPRPNRNPTEPEPVFEPESKPNGAGFRTGTRAGPEPDVSPYQSESDDVLELTEQMLVSKGDFDETIISRRRPGLDRCAVRSGAGILDRRELAIGDRGITLEAMVRGMLRPCSRNGLIAISLT